MLKVPCTFYHGRKSTVGAVDTVLLRDSYRLYLSHGIQPTVGAVDEFLLKDPYLCIARKILEKWRAMFIVINSAVRTGTILVGVFAGWWYLHTCVGTWGVCTRK